MSAIAGDFKTLGCLLGRHCLRKSPPDKCLHLNAPLHGTATVKQDYILLIHQTQVLQNITQGRHCSKKEPSLKGSSSLKGPSSPKGPPSIKSISSIKGPSSLKRPPSIKGPSSIKGLSSLKGPSSIKGPSSVRFFCSSHFKFENSILPSIHYDMVARLCNFCM